MLSKFSRNITSAIANEYVKKYNESLRKSEVKKISRLMTPAEIDEFVKKHCTEYSLKIDKNETQEESKIEKIQIIPVKRFQISFFEQFENALKRYPKFKDTPQFKKKVHHAIAYFELMGRRQSGDFPNCKPMELYRSLAEKYQISATTIMPWMRGKNTPWLVSKLSLLEDARIRSELTLEQFQKTQTDQTAHQGNIVSRENNEEHTKRLLTIDEIDCRLLSDPDIMTIPSFKKQYDHAKTFTKMMQRRETGDRPQVGTEELYKELAKEYAISVATAKNWYSGKYTPRLVTRLTKDDGIHQEFSSSSLQDTIHSLKEKNSPQKIESQNLVDTLSKMNEYQIMPERDFKRIAENIFQEISNLEPSCVRFFDLSDFPKVSNSIQSNREEFEHILSTQTDFATSNHIVKVGITDNKLYVRLRDTSVDNWLNAHAHHHFHFRSYEAKREIVEIGRAMLEINDDAHLSDVIKEISDYSGRIDGVSKNNSDLKRNLPYLVGETLHFLLDSSFRSLEDVKNQISMISGTGQVNTSIHNPLFPDMDIPRAKLTAIMMSDGHVSDSGASYYEQNIGRLHRVKGHFRDLGDMDIWESFDECRTKQLRFAKVIGDLLSYWGIPIGNKTNLNRGLPWEVRNGSFDVAVNYTEQLFPEDGNYSKNIASWSRTISQADVSEDIIKFLCENGDSKVSSPSGGKQEYHYVVMPWGKLKDYAKSEIGQVSKAAQWMIDNVEANRCKLIDDQAQLIQKLGVKFVIEATTIKYHETSERVTVTWTARTATVEDTIRLALLAPPDHQEKLESLVKWMAGRPDKINRIWNEIQQDGLEIRKEWEPLLSDIS